MPRSSCSILINASCETVFDLLHDYSRRLEWDSMLSEASLLAGASAAGPGVRSMCVGTWKSAFLRMETEYVSFHRGRMAAVRMTNRPPLFSRFSATIKHETVDHIDCSRTTYIYSFRADPKCLAPLLEPIMTCMIDREIRSRLRALRGFLEQEHRPDAQERRQ